MLRPSPVSPADPLAKGSLMSMSFSLPARMAMAAAAMAIPLAVAACSSGRNAGPDLTATDILLLNGYFGPAKTQGEAKSAPEADPHAPGTIARKIFRELLAESPSPDAAKLAAIRSDWMRLGRDAYTAGDPVGAERAWRVALLLGLEKETRREELADGRELVVIPVLRAGVAEDGAAWLRLMVEGDSDEPAPPRLGTGKPGETANVPDVLSMNAFAARALRMTGGVGDDAMVISEPTAVMVVARPEDARMAESMLAFSADRPQLVTVETRMIEMDRATAREYFKAVTESDPFVVVDVHTESPLPMPPRLNALFADLNESAEVTAVKLNGEQGAELQRLTRNGPARSISAPRLTLHGGQAGTISMVNQVSYVQDFQVERVGDVMIADPVIGVVNDGLVVGARAHPVAGGGYLAGVSVTYADLKLPIPTFTTTLGVGSPVTIQIPSVQIHGSSVIGTFEEGETYLLSRPIRMHKTRSAEKGGEYVYLAVTIRMSKAAPESGGNSGSAE